MRTQVLHGVFHVFITSFENFWHVSSLCNICYTDNHGVCGIPNLKTLLLLVPLSTVTPLYLPPVEKVSNTSFLYLYVATPGSLTEFWLAVRRLGMQEEENTAVSCKHFPLFVNSLIGFGQPIASPCEVSFPICEGRIRGHHHTDTQQESIWASFWFGFLEILVGCRRLMMNRPRCIKRGDVVSAARIRS